MGDIWNFLRKYWKPDKDNVHTKEHEALDDEDKIVEDVLVISRYIFEKEKWQNIESIKCEDFYNCLAFFKDGSTKEYELDWHIGKDDNMKERFNELEAILDGCDQEYIVEQIEIKSKEYFSK